MICTYICTYKLGNMYYLIVNNVGGDGEKEWTLFFVVVVMQLRNVEKQTDVHVQCTMVESAGNSSKMIKYGQYI